MKINGVDKGTRSDYTCFIIYKCPRRGIMESAGTVFLCKHGAGGAYGHYGPQMELPSAVAVNAINGTGQVCVQ